jgi:hypothetical protein
MKNKVTRKAMKPSLIKKTKMSQHQTAKNFGWSEVPVKSGDVGRMESYSRDIVRLNYYPSTRCVAISMDHPSQGKTQMFQWSS